MRVAGLEWNHNSETVPQLIHSLVVVSFPIEYLSTGNEYEEALYHTILDSIHLPLEKAGRSSAVLIPW